MERGEMADVETELAMIEIASYTVSFQDSN